MAGRKICPYSSKYFEIGKNIDLIDESDELMKSTKFSKEAGVLK